MADDVPSPTLQALHAYLRFEGWSQQTGGPAGAMWSSNGRRVGVPSTPDDELIMGVVRRLAAMQGRSVKETAAAIRFLLFDVTHLRAGGRHADADAIPLATAARILSGAKAMLRATATTARAERAQIGTSYSTLGDGVIRESLMGHTTRGFDDAAIRNAVAVGSSRAAYVIPVLVPLPAPEALDLHQPTLESAHEGIEFHRAPAEPFERRVVRTFAQSIQAMKELVVDPGKPPRADEVHELIYRGVSREFCTALAGILGQRNIVDFETSIHWAPAIPAPTTMPHSVTIDAAALDLIQRTAEKLKQQRIDPNRVFSGTIVQLRHESPDDPFGEIAVSTVRRGKPAEIIVRLRLDRYRDAWDWHFQGRAVLIEGAVRRGSPGRALRVDEPRRCQPLDEMMLVPTPSQ